MIETLRTIIESELEWNFSYGRRDFQNLTEAAASDDPKPFFFMDPVDRTPERSSSTGNLTGWTTYEGRYMILLKSKLDEVYDGQKEQDPEIGKWKTRIRPIVEDVSPDTALLTQLENALTCGTYDWHFVSQRIKEVINMFDGNFDGVLVNFKWRVK